MARSALDRWARGGIPDERRGGPGLRGSSANVRSGVGALGETYGAFAGDIDAVGTRRDRLRPQRQVPWATSSRCGRVLSLPLRTLEGSFSADVRVRGTGTRPRVAGDVRGPRAPTTAWPSASAGPARRLAGGVAARAGAMTVGSTRARVDASVAAGAFALDVRADTPTWPTSTTTSTRPRRWREPAGSAVALATTTAAPPAPPAGSPCATCASGASVRHDDANWAQRGGAVDAVLAVRSAHGSLRASGTVVPAPAACSTAFRAGSYRVAAPTAGHRSGHLAAAVRPDRAGPGPGRRARQRRRALPAPGRRRRRDPAPRLGLRLRGPGRPRPRAQRRRPDRAQRHQRRPGLRPVRRQRLVRPRAARAAGAGGPRPTADLGEALARVAPRGPQRDRGRAPADARICGPCRAARRARLPGHRRPLRDARRSAHPGQPRLRRQDARRARPGGDLPPGNVLVAGSLPLSRQPSAWAPRAVLVHAGAEDLDLTQFSPFVPGPETQAGRHRQRPDRDRGHARGAAGGRQPGPGRRLGRLGHRPGRDHAGERPARPSPAPASRSKRCTPTSAAARSMAAAGSTCRCPTRRPAATRSP